MNVLRDYWTVLLVEDDDAIRESLAEALSFAGIGVFTARSVAGAKNVLRTFPGRALVVLDLDLPDGRGEDVLEFLRDVPSATSRFPVVVASGAEHAGTLAKAPFVIDVVRKPVVAAELARRIYEQAQLFAGESS